MGDIKRKIDGKDVEFHFAEASWSKNRGIQIYRKGVASDSHTYQFDPNPHDNPKYNKSQVKFYSEAADFIADYVAEKKEYPPFGKKVTIFGEAYTLKAH